MKTKRKNGKEKRAEQVRQLVSERYRPGRQDRSKRWVYLNFVKRQFHISESTFWRSLRN